MFAMTQPARWITTEEARTRLKEAGIEVSLRWVQILCQTGRLEAEKAGRDWLIAPAAVDAYTKRRQAPEADDDSSH